MEKTSCLITEYSSRDRRSCSKNNCTYYREIKSKVKAVFHRPAGGGAVGDDELSFDGSAQTYRCVAKRSGIIRLTLDYSHCPTLYSTVPCFADDGPAHSGFGDLRQPKIYFDKKVNGTILGVCIFFLIIGFILLIPGLLALLGTIFSLCCK
jgi:hypothetical protein